MGELSGPELHALARLVHVGLSVIDLVDPGDPETWVIRFNNPAASAASRSDVERFRGELFLQAFPAVRDTPFIGWYQAALASGEESEIPEVTYGDTNVPEAAFRVWLTPLTGNLVMGQYVNVTEQRRAEGRLRKANASLEARVEQRTEELRRSRQTMREIAYAAAHDLRSPVRQLQLLLDLMQREVGSDAGRQEARRAREIAQRVQANLDALMSFASVQDTAEASLFSPASVVEKALDALRPLHRDARVTVAVDVEQLHGPKDQFEILVFQLLSNALTYHAKADAAVVDIRVALEDGHPVLEVVDQGIGIPQEQHGTIFEAFRRLQPAAAYPGAGVGLTLAANAAQALGSNIRVHSSEGAGATFQVRFQPFTLPAAPLA